eukprot:5093434-Alexandrium_andersonii.AAC.1
MEDHLASAVQAYWEGQHQLVGTVPHRRLARDVWELLDDGGAQLRQLESACPRGTRVLAVAGSPCQDISTSGASGGVAGPCGARSSLFYAVP